MRPKVVLVTGPPLNGRDDYLKRVLPLLRPMKVHGYHVFSEMQLVGGDYGAPNLNRTTVLDLSPETLGMIRSAALGKIKKEIATSENDIEIVSTPATFRIKPSPSSPSGHIKGLEEEDFEELAPDLTILFISDLQEVRKNLVADRVWSTRVEPTLKTLAEWRRESIDLVENYVNTQVGKRRGEVDNIIYAAAHPPQTMADLILGRKPRVYISFHITGVPARNFRRVEKTKKRLSKDFICIDPYANRDWDIIQAYDVALEKGQNEVVLRTGGIVMSRSEVEDAIDEIRAQTVERDYQLIDHVHATVVLHFSKQASAGVTAEIIHTRTVANNPVYVLYPFKDRPSPFFEFYAGREHIIQGSNVEDMTTRLVEMMKDDVKANRWPNWAGR